MLYYINDYINDYFMTVMLPKSIECIHGCIIILHCFLIYIMCMVIMINL